MNEHNRKEVTGGRKECREAQMITQCRQDMEPERGTLGVGHSDFTGVGHSDFLGVCHLDFIGVGHLDFIRVDHSYFTGVDYSGFTGVGPSRTTTNILF